MYEIIFFYNCVTATVCPKYFHNINGDNNTFVRNGSMHFLCVLYIRPCVFMYSN